MTPARLMHDAPRSAGDPLAALVTLGRPLVMGILNVTPDSFSDGGRFLDPAVAIAHAREMKDQGADMARYRRGIDPALWRRQTGRCPR